MFLDIHAKVTSFTSDSSVLVYIQKVSKKIINKMLTSRSISFIWEGSIIKFEHFTYNTHIKITCYWKISSMDGPEYTYILLSDKFEG